MHTIPSSSRQWMKERDSRWRACSSSGGIAVARSSRATARTRCRPERVARSSSSRSFPGAIASVRVISRACAIETRPAKSAVRVSGRCPTSAMVSRATLASWAVVPDTAASQSGAPANPARWCAPPDAARAATAASTAPHALRIRARSPSRAAHCSPVSTDASKPSSAPWRSCTALCRSTTILLERARTAKGAEREEDLRRPVLAASTSPYRTHVRRARLALRSSSRSAPSRCTHDRGGSWSICRAPYTISRARSRVSMHRCSPVNSARPCSGTWRGFVRRAGRSRLPWRRGPHRAARTTEPDSPARRTGSPRCPAPPPTTPESPSRPLPRSDTFPRPAPHSWPAGFRWRKHERSPAPRRSRRGTSASCSTSQRVRACTAYRGRARAAGHGDPS